MSIDSRIYRVGNFYLTGETGFSIWRNRADQIAVRFRTDAAGEPLTDPLASKIKFDSLRSSSLPSSAGKMRYANEDGKESSQLISHSIRNSIIDLIRSRAYTPPPTAALGVIPHLLLPPSEHDQSKGQAGSLFFAHRLRPPRRGADSPADGFILFARARSAWIQRRGKRTYS